MITPLRRASPTLLAAALLLAPCLAAAEVGLWQENDQSRVRLITPWAEAPAAGELIAGLEFEVVPGWHVYWKNSGDAGYPPAISFAPTPEVTAGELLYPAPERYELPGDLVAFGYEDHVVYPLRLELDAVGRDGVTLAADLDYLVCEVDCVPYSYRLSVDQPLAAPGGEPRPDPERAGLLARWRQRVPRPAEEVAGLETGGVLDLSDPDRPRLTVTVAGAAAAPGVEPELFLESHGTFDAGEPQWQEDGEMASFRVPLSFRQRPEALPRQAEFAWTVTGLEPLGGEGGGPVPLEARRTVPARGAPAAVPAATATTATTAASPVLVILGVLAGGLLLHLFPTVLPLTAVRLSEVGRETDGRRGAALSTAAGLATGGLAVGMAGPLIAGGGRAVGWGSQLQEPVLLAALALLATLAALHLWGLIRLFPRRGAARGLLVGIVAAALGLAWNPPLLGRSFGPAWAADAGAALAAAAALAFALGLAAPFLAAAAVPRWTAALARLTAPPGQGRTATGEGLAFLEAAGVLWLFYLLSGLMSSAGLAFLQVALLTVALGAWLLGSARRPVWTAVGAILLLLAAVAVLGLAGAHGSTTSGETGTDPASARTVGTVLPSASNVDPSS